MKGDFSILNCSEEQIKSWKVKAEKWDALGESIGRCYPDFDEDGNDIGSEKENADLTTIGELAAGAFGYL